MSPAVIAHFWLLKALFAAFTSPLLNLRYAFRVSSASFRFDLSRRYQLFKGFRVLALLPKKSSSILHPASGASVS
jgi:hypothetical protein